MASPIHEALESVFGGEDLSADAADAAMTQIMSGEATDAQIGAFLAGLRMKGESVSEITGCARAMKRVAVQVRPTLGGQRLLDTCGTGGDQTGTFNISTTVAFVVAGAGEKVAKHGNRSASSQCGSADVLEELGVKLDLGPEQVAECIEDVGIGFSVRAAVSPRHEVCHWPAQGVGDAHSFQHPRSADEPGQCYSPGYRRAQPRSDVANGGGSWADGEHSRFCRSWNHR